FDCFFGACSAFTQVMACTLAESLNDPFHRRLRQLRCLHCRFDCYRVERTSSRAGVTPAEVQRLFTAHSFANYPWGISLLSTSNSFHSPRDRNRYGPSKEARMIRHLKEKRTIFLTITGLCLMIPGIAIATDNQHEQDRVKESGNVMEELLDSPSGVPIS